MTIDAQVKDYWLNHKAVSYYFSMPHVNIPTDEAVLIVEQKHLQYQIDRDRYWDESRDYCSKERDNIFTNWRDTPVKSFELNRRIISRHDRFLFRSFDCNKFIYNVELKRRKWFDTVKEHKSAFSILYLTDNVFRETCKKAGLTPINLIRNRKYIE